MAIQTMVEKTTTVVGSTIIPYILEDGILRFHFLVQGNVEITHIGNVVRNRGGELGVVTKSVDTIIRQVASCFLMHILTSQCRKHSAICA